MVNQAETPRPIEEEWVLDIRDQCEHQNVKVLFKHWGGKNKKRRLAGYFRVRIQRYAHCEIAGSDIIQNQRWEKGKNYFSNISKL